MVRLFLLLREDSIARQRNNNAILFAEILMIFNENSYTVAEGSVVEVCVEPAGYNERSDIQLSLYPTTGST